MRRKRYGFLSILLAFVLAFATILPSGVGQMVAKAEETNYIVNGDFENGDSIEPWTFTIVSGSDLPTASISDWAKCSGEKGLVLNNPWKDNSSTPQEVKLTQTIATLPAGDYKFSVTMAGFDYVSSGFKLIKNGEVDESSWTDNCSTDWNDFQTYTIDILVDSDQTNYEIGFDLWLSASDKSLLLDDISLTAVSTETPSAPLENLKTLIKKAPSNYETAGFQAASAQALGSALSAAQELVEAGSASAEEIAQAYQALDAALKGLVYEDPSIQVEKVAGLSERPDFIKGVDISSYLSETASGVVYKNQAGEVVSGKEFIKMFAEQGINYIRLRVWNAPYDLDSSGKKLYYGGGNNDMDTTLELCKIIKEYNNVYASTGGAIKVLIDLQYSDFWADPDKQTAPKAWKDMDITAKTEAVKNFTKDCLKQVEETGVTIGMVQIGNETNTGICGTKYDTEDYYAVFRAGCDAVEEYNEANGYTRENGSWIKRVVHFTDPQSASTTFAKSLKDHNVSYDVYATSYYPFWHGTTENLKTMLSDIAKTCGCEVMVAETQYVYTNEDYDGADNQAYEGKENINLTQWPVSVQGQANEIRDVINAVAQVGNAGIGMFYWEPGWLGVGNAYNADGTLNETALAENRQKWNTYGSGWASDYAKSYDEQAAKWGGGGTNNENASLFDFTGNPLASLNVFKYVNYGAVAQVKSFYRADPLDAVVVPMGTSASELVAKLAASVGFSYNDKTTGSVSITWNSAKLEELAKTISTTNAIGNSFIAEGSISVGGTEHKVTCEILVAPRENLLVNGDFEKSVGEEWSFENGKVLWWGGDNPRNGIGAVILNTYSSASEDADANGCFSDCMSQEVTGLDAGTYEIKGFFEGLDGAGARTGEEITISAVYGDGQSVKSDPIRLNGWMSWQSATVSVVITEDMVKAGKNSITVKVNVCLQKDSWGSVDDIYLYKVEGAADDTNPDDSSGNTSSGSTSSGSQTTLQPDNTSVVANPDGGTTETRKDVEQNQAGNAVSVTTVTVKDASGRITSVTKTSVIANAANGTSATVTVETNGVGVVSAAADVTREGKLTATGRVNGTISAAVVKQIVEAAETSDVLIRQTVTNTDGSTRFTVEVHAQDLTAGRALKIMKLDPKTNEYYLCNAKDYEVSKDGGVNLTLKTAGNFVLLNEKDAKAASDAILKTIKVKKSSASVKAGKTVTAALNSAFNMKNVSKITYTTSNKAVAAVDKKGKVTAKKSGTVSIKVKVVLKNGETKTVTMKVTVKK